MYIKGIIMNTKPPLPPPHSILLHTPKHLLLIHHLQRLLLLLAAAILCLLGVHAVVAGEVVDYLDEECGDCEGDELVDVVEVALYFEVSRPVGTEVHKLEDAG